MKIKIKYFEGAQPLEQFSQGNWVDLRSNIDIEMKYREFALIPLGVAMQLPNNFEAYIVPRSSTFKNFGIIQTNHMGVVDFAYSGSEDQWFFPAYALRIAKIKKGDRICQFRIQQIQPNITFIESELSPINRGGHGSTGIK